MSLRVEWSDPRDGIESNLVQTVRRVVSARDGTLGRPPGVPAWCVCRHGDPDCYWLHPQRGTTSSGPLTAFESGVLPTLLSESGGPHVRVRARTYTKFSGEEGELHAWVPGRDAAEALRTLVAASVMGS